MDRSEETLTPREIVSELDKYIIGQQRAKRAVALALRNRYRRKRLPPELRDEVSPKNIIMIGSTGVGKTEIARRLARMVSAPFIKVEATKFTEVGYVGRDVESMIRDLVENAIRIVKEEKMAGVQAQAARLAEERLVSLLAPQPGAAGRKARIGDEHFSSAFQDSRAGDDQQAAAERLRRAREARVAARERLRRGELENELVELEIEERKTPMIDLFAGQGLEEMGFNFQEMLGHLVPSAKKKRRLTVAQARKILAQEEAEKLIDKDDLHLEAIDRAEQLGIVFLDEIDKIAGRSTHGPDVSREGVQRDILPLVEGSTVTTKYGVVKTDHMLFIAAGAFHMSKPSDLIPELQGRFPIRVELDNLSEADFQRILTEPENALLKQYTALLETEGLSLEFTGDAVEAIAGIAFMANEELENIGARRLHTILEKVLEDLSFDAPEMHVAPKIIIDRAYVENKLDNIVKNKDLSKYIL